MMKSNKWYLTLLAMAALAATNAYFIAETVSLEKDIEDQVKIRVRLEASNKGLVKSLDSLEGSIDMLVDRVHLQDALLKKASKRKYQCSPTQ